LSFLPLPLHKLDPHEPLRDPLELLKKLKENSRKILEKNTPQTWIDEKLKKELHPQQIENLNDLKSGKSVAVITGQQPCLLGGPSLTLHKILHTLSITEWLNSKGLKAVPIFWSASEDHDLYEMLRVELWNDDFSPKMHKLNGLSRGFAAETFKEPTSLHDSLKKSLSPWLKDAFFSKPSERYVDPFHHALQAIFGSKGLLVVEPKDFTSTSGPFWDSVAQKKQDLLHAYEKDEKTLTDQDIPIQAPRRRGLPIFTLNSVTGERDPITYNKGAFFQSSEEKATSELGSLLSKNERLSPGALLRPIFAQSQLPILVSVLGPAEYLYHQQIKTAYKTLNCDMPFLWPRLGGTWVPENLGHLFQTDLTELDNFVKTSEKGWLNEDTLFEQKIKPLQIEVKKLEAYYQNELLIGLGPLTQLKKDLASALNKLERNLKKSDLAKQGWPKSKIELLENLLKPKGQPQERRLGWVQFLTSESKLNELITCFKDPFDFSHRLYR